MNARIPATMKAVVYRGAHELRVEELPVPAIGPDEVLVKVAACGVCPTDIKKIQHATVPPPRVFGHETAGTIVKLGSAVRGFAEGQRVGVHHHVPCLDCHFCRHGAFAQCATYRRTGVTAGFEPAGGGYAEYVRVMSFCLPGLVPIPDGNSFEEGALLEPVNTVLKGVRRLGLLSGDTVLVAGQGPIGLLFTALLSAQGMRVIATDLLQHRLELARHWGASAAWPADAADLPDQIRRSAGPDGVDAAVIAVPSDAAVAVGMEVVRGGGRVLLFAHTRRGGTAAVDLAGICVDERDLIGSYSADLTLQPEVAEWVFSRRLDVRPLITHRFALTETAQAVALAARPTEESLKILVCHDRPPSA